MSYSLLKLLYLKSGSLNVPGQSNCFDFSDNNRCHMSYYQPNTRGWFIAEVEKCLCQQNIVLWLNGNAGMGKSVITAILLDKYIKRDMVCAWHFCTHSNPSQNTVLAIILSLSGMLEITIPGYAKALHSQGDAVLQEAKTNDDPMELFKVFFLTPLSEIDPPKDSDGNLKRFIAFFDALDEMIYKQMNKMLTILRDGFPYLPSFILLFVTSRRNDNILSALSEKVRCATYRLHHHNTHTHKEDSSILIEL
mmetsp:Transcript_28409/g.28755  ORF Transcript_28409/g.28755 Transcript_28409/m.28755 type:complete len:250 (-) Transcript_28409:71-820(-)